MRFQYFAEFRAPSIGWFGTLVCKSERRFACQCKDDLSLSTFVDILVNRLAVSNASRGQCMNVHFYILDWRFAHFVLMRDRSNREFARMFLNK